MIATETILVRFLQFNLHRNDFIVQTGSIYLQTKVKISVLSRYNSK